MDISAPKNLKPRLSANASLATRRTIRPIGSQAESRSSPRTSLPVHSPFRDQSQRLDRAARWLANADQQVGIEAKFISLWTSFVTLYSKRELQKTEAEARREFLSYLITEANARDLYDIVWEIVPYELRILVWESNKSSIDLDENGYKLERFKNALEQEHAFALFDAIFSYIYSLRNAIAHGTWLPTLGLDRQLVAAAYRILARCIPIFVSELKRRLDAPEC